VFFAVLIAGFIAYIKYIGKKERTDKLEEDGKSLAKTLHNLFINSVSPRLRDGMKIHSRVEKIWRREGLILRRFSRIVLEISLLSEEIKKEEVKNAATIFIRDTTNNGPKFLVGLKITKIQKNGGSMTWSQTKN